MKEITSDAIPKCFDKWCSNFDNLFKTKAQKRGFRNYIYGLMGDSERKNLQQISDNYIDVSYSSLRRFLVLSKWDDSKINERRLQLMSKCRQTKPRRNFSLIIDDSGHKKKGIGAYLDLILAKVPSHSRISSKRSPRSFSSKFFP